MQSPSYGSVIPANSRVSLGTYLAIVATDGLLAFALFAITTGYWLGRSLPAKGFAAMVGCVVLGQAAARFIRLPANIGKVGDLARLVAGNLFAAGLYLILRSSIGTAVGRGTYVELLAALTLLQVICRLTTRSPRAAGEGLRLASIAAAIVWLHEPLLTNGTIGAGDAAWYRNMAADFVSQWRDGIFPVFVGQTGFAFNGAVSPLRLAPGLQHFTGLVDLATLHSLPFGGILNATLLACYVAATLSCYACLRAIESRTPWLALAMALLFSASPGLLALAYTGDLYMSITALPFVPPLFYGAWRSLAQRDLTGIVIMVAASAALWLCHPPIALWGTLAVCVMQLLRLFRDGRQSATWRHWGIGVGCFASLAMIPAASLASLGIPGISVDLVLPLGYIRTAFPLSFRPVNPVVSDYGHYQLGWTLWGVLGLGLIGLALGRNRRLPVVALLAAAIGLYLFLAPIPGLLDLLWKSLPQAFCDITNLWPMQRLYVLLAALIVFFSFATLSGLVVRHRWTGTLLLLLAAGGAVWSVKEAKKFQKLAHRTTTPAAAVAQRMLPQNRILTRYAFNAMAAIPPYFSHGFIDPLMPNRVLAAGSLVEIASNANAAQLPSAPTPSASSGILRATRPDPDQPTLVMEPTFRLEPGRRYALTIEFAHPEFAGSLSFRGQRLSRDYWMPDSGYDTKTVAPSQAFGALPDRSHTVTLWTDGNTAEDVRLIFFFTDPQTARAVTEYGTYRFHEFDPANLPVNVTGLAPYRAKVRTSAPAFLETPQLFLEGYRAIVNGKTVKPRRSPYALLMVPLEPGENSVQIDFPGPTVLRLAYFLSGTCWLTLLAFGTVLGWRTIRRPGRDRASAP